jgi:MFS-type transporter involved in bile tolerance (Atg22 family)
MNTTLCQSSTNKPDDGCPSESSFYQYQPPLPSFITASDIDCQDSAWKDEGTCGYYYCKDQADGIKSAATVMSIPYIISAVLSPFLGGFVDKFGLRAVIATIGESFF